MLSRKAVALLGLIAVLSVTIAACGSDSSSDSTESSSSPTSSDTTASEPLKSVTFLTGFGFAPWEAGFAVASEEGYYEEAGLDVELKAGQGSTSNLQLLANGNADFTQVGGGAIAGAAEKGVPVRAVASFFQNGGSGIAADPEIKTAKELDGKSIGAPAFTFSTFLLPLYEKKIGASLDVVNVEAPEPAFLQGKIEGLTALEWGEVPELEADGKEFSYFSYADVGLNVIGPCITVNQDMLESEPDTVKAFVEASAKGYEFAYENPEKAATIVHELWPTTEPKYDEAVIPTLEAAAHTEASEGLALGYMAKEDWEQVVSVLVEGELLKKPVPVDSLYENVLPEN